MTNRNNIDRFRIFSKAVHIGEKNDSANCSRHFLTDFPQIIKETWLFSKRFLNAFLLMQLLWATACNANPQELNGHESHSYTRVHDKATIQRHLISRAGAATFLLLDGQVRNRSLITKVRKSVQAVYDIDKNGRYQAQNITGFVSPAWKSLESSSSQRNSLIDSYSQNGMPLRLYKGNIVDQGVDYNSVLAKHSIYPLEAITYYNPQSQVVLARDFQMELGGSFCEQINWNPSTQRQKFKLIEDQLVEMIRRHRIQFLSRSMRRRTKRLLDSAARECGSFNFKHFLNYVKSEQILLSRLSQRTKIIIINSAHNDPEPRRICYRGRCQANPIFEYRPANVLFVGYTNQPDLDFFPEGQVLRSQWLPVNQRKNNIFNLVIDGNLDDESLVRATERLERSGTNPYQIAPRWWFSDSFFFIYGHSLRSPFYLSPHVINVSGFSTSWATPLATSMLHYFAEKRGLFAADGALVKNALTEFKNLVNNRVFDPLHNQQFKRR